VPFLARWPAKIPAGKKTDFPVSSIDLFPTIMEATETELPNDRPIDGLSLLDHLESGGKKAPKRETLIWHFPHYRHAPGPYSIIRKGNYKLIKFWEGIYELYDLKNDLGEANNLAESKPGLVKKLETELVARLKADGARLPKPNLEYKK
jgi:arylsulfatase A-like enzyme